MAKYRLTEDGVLDTDNGMSIPNAPGNRHWAEYQAWRKAGNEPDTAAAPPAPPSEEQQAEAELAGSRVLKALIGVLAEDRGISEQALIGRIKAKVRGR